MQELGVSSRLMLKEALLSLDEWRRGARFQANLEVLKRVPSPGKKARRTGRANVN